MIELSGITFSYKRKKILSNLSLSVAQGECIGIAGKNGCGKSTLLAVMAGALKPQAGSIFYSNENALKKHSVFSRTVGYVPQDNPLIPELSVRDNLKLWYGAGLQQALSEGLPASLGISAYLKTPVHKLSGGMKKRVSLALAYANHPPVLILDEPSTALDLPGKEDIRIYLQTYLQQGGTIVITTHDEAELSLCTKLFVLKNGALTQVHAGLRGEPLIRQL